MCSMHKPMELQIKLLDNGELIRQAFIEKFLENYPSDLMWPKLKREYPSISFAAALELLRNLPGDVLFMSEGPAYSCAHPLHYQGRDYLHFVARAEAKALSALIEFEWMEDARLLAQNMYLANTILPEDLYVFSPEMDRVLIFTHETDDYEAELADDYIRQAESRICFACNFE